MSGFLTTVSARAEVQIERNEVAFSQPSDSRRCFNKAGVSTDLWVSLRQVYEANL